MFEKFFQRLVDRAVQQQQNRERLDRLVSTAPSLASVDGPPTAKFRQFTVHDAMNGQYIEYMRRKYNPNGPDEYVREVYIVQPGESLVDAISTVLVILEK